MDDRMVALASATVDEIERLIGGMAMAGLGIGLSPKEVAIVNLTVTTSFLARAVGKMEQAGLFGAQELIDKIALETIGQMPEVREVLQEELQGRRTRRQSAQPEPAIEPGAPNPNSPWAP